MTTKIQCRKCGKTFDSWGVFISHACKAKREGRSHPRRPTVDQAVVMQETACPTCGEKFGDDNAYFAHQAAAHPATKPRGRGEYATPVTVSISASQDAGLQLLVSRGIYTSRSEAIRAAIHAQLLVDYTAEGKLP